MELYISDVDRGVYRSSVCPKDILGEGKVIFYEYILKI